MTIVTRASGGIGESTARLLHRRGALVVLSARRKAELDRIADDLPGSFSVVADVTQPDSVARMVDGVLKKFGRIDILVNNAGILLYKPMMGTNLDEIRNVMETNFFGAVHCVHAVVSAMERQGQGWIVNVSSIAGRVGFPFIGYYCASKFAMTGFSETLRQELKPKNIFVSTVSPGTVYTPMTKNIVDDAISRGKNVMPISPDVVAVKILDAVEKRKLEVFVPKLTHLAYLLHFFFPRFLEWLAWRFRASDEGGIKKSG